MKALNLGISEILFDAVASGVQNSTAFALPSPALQLTWQTSFGSAPASISIQLQVSNDNLVWSAIDTSTSISGESRTLVTSALFVRGRVDAISGGSGITFTVVAKRFVSSLSIGGDSATVTQIVDLTASQLANLHSNPIVVFVGGPNYVIQVLSGYSQSISGSIPFTSNLTGDVVYAGSPSTRLTSDKILDQDPAVVNPSQSVPMIKRTQEPRSFFENQNVILIGGQDDLTGGIATVTINNGGSGYVVGDTVTDAFSPNNVIRIDAVSSGVVTALHVTSPGYGASVGTGHSTTALTGSGTGLIVNVTAITPANGTARVWVTARILSLP